MCRKKGIIICNDEYEYNSSYESVTASWHFHIPKGIFQDVKMIQWKFHNALSFIRLIVVLKFHNAHEKQVALLSGDDNSRKCRPSL